MKEIFKTMVFLFVAALVASTSTAFGADLFVPGEYPTVQSAIEAAVDGDTVHVAAGTYVENIDYIGKNIELLSDLGADVTILDGGQAGPVVTFAGGESDQAILNGFSVVNGAAESGGGILCQGSSPIIAESLIVGNSADLGGGVLLSASDATVMNCTISDNQSVVYGGGGIACTDSSDPDILNCDILRNSAADSGGGVFSDLSTPRIEDCLIEDNQASANGGGVGQINGSNATIVTCFISNNSASSYGGGIDHVESSSTIANCEITGNDASGGGGISFYNSVGPNVLNCTLSANTAGQGGGVLCEASSALLQNCILWADSAPAGSELSVQDGAALTVGYCAVQYGDTGADVDPGSNLVWSLGNIVADPLFVGGGDYHLLTGSPCVDAGTNVGVYNDIDEHNRPMKQGYDMGYDEYRPLPEEFQVILIYATPRQTSVYLRWEDPMDSDYPNGRVYIRRGTDGFPLDPSEGVEIYSGAGLTYEDTGLNPDQTYYYAVWMDDGTPYATPREGSTNTASSTPNLGRVKICLRDEASELNFWFLTDGGAKKAEQHASDTTLAPEWKIAAVGDIDRDGIDDIVFHNRASGVVNYWLFDPDGIQNYGGTVTEERMESPWIIAGSGDINRDGTVDLIWHNDQNGRVDYWLLNRDGTLGVEGRVNTTSVRYPWWIESTGDIDGDGVMDLVFRNKKYFKLNYWLLNPDGTQKSGGTMMPKGPGKPWFIAGMGDIDGDGSDDLIWRNESKRLVNYWLLNPNGTKRIGGRITSESIFPDWSVAGVGDIDLDGTIDLIMHNETEGRIDYWLLNPNGSRRSVGRIDEPALPATWTVDGVNG